MRNRISISIFYLSILIMGLSPVFFNVLLLREFISNFFGNELIIAIFIALWLVIEALGSGLLSRPMVRRIDPVSLYCFLLTLNAILGPLCIFLSRVIRNVLFLEFGEVPSFFLISLGTLMVIFPLAAIDGCMFTAGYHMGFSFKKKSTKSVGHVYAVESLGSVLGGVFVTLLILSNLSPFSIILILSFVNIIVALSLIVISRGVNRKKSILSPLTTVAALVVVFIFLLNLSWFEEKSTSIRWREYDVLAYKNSLYHNIVLTEKGNQRCLFVDGKAVLSLPHGDVVSIEEFAHIPLLYAEGIQRILLIGEGPGGLIDEFLSYPNVTIDYLQLDGEIIKTLLNARSRLIEREFTNPRVTVIKKDAISYVKSSSSSYDAVFIAVGCPSTFLSGRYFTTEFFVTLKKVLSHDGLVAIKTIGGESYITEELKLMLSTMYATLRQSFQFVHFIPGETLILLASDHINFPALPLSRIFSLLKSRDLKTEYLSPYSLKVKYHPAKVHLFQKIFEGSGKEINLVNKPLLVNHALSYESSIYDRSWSALLSYLRKIPRGAVFFVFLFPILLIVLFTRISKGVRNLVIPLTIGLTGLAGMVGSMAITIFFQELFGSLYLKMGLIFSSFMLGLFISALTISRKLPHRYSTQRFILLIECLLFLFFLVLVPIFYQFSIIQTDGITFTVLEVSLYFLNSLLGGLVGIEFPVANSLMEREGKEAGGTLYAFDLIGAFIGSIMVVTLFLPFMGFFLIFILIASVKFMNIFLILSKIR